MRVRECGVDAESVGWDSQVGGESAVEQAHGESPPGGASGGGVAPRQHAHHQHAHVLRQGLTHPARTDGQMMDECL